MKFEWDDERLRLPNGVVYVLASEDTAGRHGGRFWEVFVYDKPGQRATRVVNVGGSVWPTKVRARRAAERDALAVYGEFDCQPHSVAGKKS